jgi:transposase InsO family protein
MVVVFFAIFKRSRVSMYFLQLLPCLIACVLHWQIFIWICSGKILALDPYQTFYRKRPPIPAPWRTTPDKPLIRRTRAKPLWVTKEVLRLAALTGKGCRAVEKLFNRLHAARHNTTVGKSFVSYTIRHHRYEIAVMRRDIRRKPPRPVPLNDTWAIDMTGKGDLAGHVHAILGIEDHGSRKLLTLQVLKRQNAWTLLGHLFLAIGRYGVPRALRSDNASVFRSRVFRWGCQFAGIRQQFSVPGCPWMNGRIERLFGTLKQKLDQVEIDSREALVHLLKDFGIWYNAVRPHQNMGGLTPDEAWRGANPYANTPRSVHWFEAWDGLLKGYYLRC